MIYFKSTLVDQAERILKLNSTNDDKKAATDLAQITDMIESREESMEYLHAVRELDNKMKNEYPIISRMLNVANRMQKIPISNARNQTWNNLIDGAVEDLKADRYGILLTVLIKHKVVTTTEEFIDWVE